MSQSNLNHHVIVGVSRNVKDLTNPIDVSDIPGRIIQVTAERYTAMPGLVYDLTITYQNDSDNRLPMYRKLARVSEHRLSIHAECVDHVGVTQERPAATPFAALVVMSGDVEPTYEVVPTSDDRNHYISNPHLSGEFTVYYVKPEKGDVVWLSEYTFIGNSYHTRPEGLGYYRVAASSASEAVRVAREYFERLGVFGPQPKAAPAPAPTPAKAPQRTYLQFEDLEPGKVYQGFCLEEQVPNKLFEVGENPLKGKAVRAVGGRMWMAKEDMRPFVYLEVPLVPHDEAMEEYKKGV
uniref:Uncharacterized protein n=1 Tax=Pseudomonas phage vB_PaeS_HTN2 TaxID=3236647 RepID=A0AB39AI77_9VIRU